MKHSLAKRLRLPLAFLLCTVLVFGGTGVLAMADTPIEPLAKYDPMITVTTVAQEGAGFSFPEGQSWEDNYWTQMCEPETGIKVAYDWIVPAAQFQQKLNLAIASGEIPDFFAVNGQQLKACVEADLITEMGQIIDDYSAPITKQTLAEDPYAIKSCTFDGKVMALPAPGAPVMGGYMFYVRTDWLNNLGMAEPKTLADFLAISEAFAKNDPDKNGKDDTYGFTFSNGLEAVYNFAVMYHAYPQLWTLDEAGAVTYGGIQQKMKPVLEQLQKMYKNKEIDPEFGVKDSAKFAESIAAGSVGLVVDSWYSPFYPLQDSVKNNPDATWKPYAFVSNDDSPAKVQGHFSTSTYYVVSKNCKNPEVVVKYANWILDKYYVKNEVVVKPEWNNVTAYAYSALWLEPPMKNLAVQQRIKQAVTSGDFTTLQPDDQNNYNIQLTYDEKKDPFGFAVKFVFGAQDSSLDIIDYYRINDLVEPTIFPSAPTELMADKKPNLDKMMAEVYTKIIMGEYDIDYFDTFVADWRKAGGDEMIAEVSDWYAANK